MNSLPLQYPGELQQYARSLALSLLLHGLAVSTAITLLGDLKMAPQPEPFRWDVSLVEATRPNPESRPAPSPAQPAQPTSASVEAHRAELQPVRRTVQVQTVQPIQQAVRQEVHRTVQEIQPLVEATAPHTAMVSRPIRSVEATHQAATEAVRSTELHAAVHEAAMTWSVAQGPQPVSSLASSAVSRSIMEAAPAAVVSQPGVTEIKPGAAVAMRPVIEATPAPVPIQESAVMRELSNVVAPIQKQVAVKEGPIMPASSDIKEASIRELPVRPVPATKADYGWLAQALWDRVERLKRYSHMARVRHLEGRVVVRAVIREDGHLRSLEVLESSGHRILDDDALEIIRRACPLKLNHPLGRPEVVVQVPINYRLED